MLGRKQSIAKEALADYGNEEMMNDSSADIEWINKVSDNDMKQNATLKFSLFSAMGPTSDEALCLGFTLLGVPQHTEDF